MELVEEMDEWYLGNLWLNDLFIDKDSLLDVVDDNDHVDEFVPKNPAEAIINGSANWDGKHEDDINDLSHKRIRKKWKQKRIRKKETKIRPMLENFLHVFRTGLPNNPTNINPWSLLSSKKAIGTQIERANNRLEYRLLPSNTKLENVFWRQSQTRRRNQAMRYRGPIHTLKTKTGKPAASA